MRQPPGKPRPSLGQDAQAEGPAYSRPRAIVFDLFGTVVHFKPRVEGPTRDTAAGTPMGWLRQVATELLSDVAFDELAAALLAVSAEIVRARPPEYLEVPSVERFRRALQRLSHVPEDLDVIASRLSAVHMRYLADQTYLPDGYSELLHALARRYPLALISNFDHEPTARSILLRHAIADCFDPIVISDGFGRRKPHLEIFRSVLATLAVAPDQAVYVGDSLADDIAGARAAGLHSVWLNPQHTPIPPGMPQPDAQIDNLHELLPFLG
jgi:HAD superfamily hydrolase (TIGR01549 family)